MREAKQGFPVFLLTRIPCYTQNGGSWEQVYTHKVSRLKRVHRLQRSKETRRLEHGQSGRRKARDQSVSLLPFHYVAFLPYIEANEGSNDQSIEALSRCTGCQHEQRERSVWKGIFPSRSTGVMKGGGGSLFRSGITRLGGLSPVIECLKFFQEILGFLVGRLGVGKEVWGNGRSGWNSCARDE